MDEEKPRRAGLSLGGRIKIVLVLLVAPALLILIAALATIPATASASNKVTMVLDPARLDQQQLLTDMVNQETGLRGYLLTDDPVFLQPYWSGRSAAAALEQRLDRLLPSQFMPGYGRVKVQIRTWEGLAELGRTQHLTTPASLATRKAHFDRLRHAFNQLDDQLASNSNAALATYQHDRSLEETLLAITIGVAVVLGIVAAVLLTRSVRRPLERLGTQLAAAASDPAQAVPGEGPSELSQLAGQVNVFRQAVFDESGERVRRALVVAQEEERRRIAAGLHDEVIQSLTAAGLRLQAVAQSADANDRDTLTGAEDAIADATEHLRNLLFELHPPALERHGLITALRTFGEHSAAPGGATLTVSGTLVGASVTAQSIAYRVAREAITNALKHASAASITVTVSERDRGVQVVIEDDGEGFDPDALRERPGHLGLELAAELVEGAGGIWSIDSLPGAGTTMRFWIPDLEVH